MTPEVISAAVMGLAAFVGSIAVYRRLMAMGRAAMKCDPREGPCRHLGGFDAVYRVESLRCLRCGARFTPDGKLLAQESK